MTADITARKKAKKRVDPPALPWAEIGLHIDPEDALRIIQDSDLMGAVERIEEGLREAHLREDPSNSVHSLMKVQAFREVFSELRTAAKKAMPEAAD